MIKSLLQFLPKHPHIRADEFWTCFFLKSYFWRRLIASKRFLAFSSTAKMDTRINIQYASNITVGEKVKIQNGTYMVAGPNREQKITIEDFALIAKDVHLLTASYDVIQSDKLIRDIPAKRGPITIKRGAFIGWGSIIYPGVTIGEKAIIPPYSCVCSDVPANSTWKPTGLYPIEK
jgi:acetyltransferase-like isoleucine patch superfamily enzyme